MTNTDYADLREILVAVTASDGIKCPRCWHYHHIADNHDGLCDRCCLTMMADFPSHEETAAIREKWEAQKMKYTRKKETKCA